MLSFLTDSADIARLNLSAKLSLQHRKRLGQFLTPAPIAKLLANQFNPLSGHINLLDPGAGVGILTASFVEKILESSEQVKSFSVTAYEIEETFIPTLEQSLKECCLALEYQGIQASYNLQKKDFTKANTDLDLPLFSNFNHQFSHAILNPPYKKINNQSAEKKALSKLGINTVNLYSAFVWLSMQQLNESGELVAITPRSFCNGRYFRPFRNALLKELDLDKIHIFESRSTAFSEDRVLQENIAFHAIKTAQKLNLVEVTTGYKDSQDRFLNKRSIPYSEIVKAEDSEQFIHIVTNSLEDSLREQMEKFSLTLDDLGLNVSTGPVVDFRLRSALRNSLGDRDCPLLYPEAIEAGKLSFPPLKPRKPIAIQKNEDTAKWLVKPGWYVLVKRFSAKEEKRRVLAATCPPLDADAIGIENHLNYYHAKGQGMDANLARGLTTFLNSTLFDTCFRHFSGHTQVNATDLRKIRYPRREDLIRLGATMSNLILDRDNVDRMMYEILPIMSDVKSVIQAKKRIEEALEILKSIAAPKQQQNERSALCLLALANIQPETAWQDATAPKRGVTEMMNWFRDHYGKQYAPNTREAVRRQTLHQFVQMSVAIENPDRPDRPINSPKWCYQLHPQALQLLQAYGSEQWKNASQNYALSVKNLLQTKRRNLPEIPVTLPDSREIQLSSGGQNKLIKDVLEKFCPKFTPGGSVLYVGDAGKKFIVNEIQKMREIGLDLDPHGKMPDLVIYYEQQDWLVLVEAVTSHGPVNLKRRNELQQLFQSASKGLVFVTAFPSRKEMTRYLAEISWETEVWIADRPEHMIHFNGERFLGPYEHQKFGS